MEEKLRKLLEDFRYESSVWKGQMKHLSKHHIDALMKDLVPFIQQVEHNAAKYCHKYYAFNEVQCCSQTKHKYESDRENN